MKFKLKISDWKDGVLETSEIGFNYFLEALHHSKGHKGHRKIYNEIGELIHSDCDDEGKTYA
jgi:hypothetical protein